MTQRIAWLAAGVLLGACWTQSSSPQTPSSQQPADGPLRARADATIRGLFEACQAGDARRVMALIAYQGDQRARRYKSPWRPDDADALEVATGTCSVLPTVGEIELIALTTHPPTPQTASEWTVTVVQRGATRLLLGFVEVDGALLLGELQDNPSLPGE